MKTRIFLSVLFILMISPGFLCHTGPHGPVDTKERTGILVRCIIFNGEVMPHVVLPVIEVTAPRNTEKMMKAIIVNGEVFPLMELEEVVVRPENNLIVCDPSVNSAHFPLIHYF